MAKYVQRSPVLNTKNKQFAEVAMELVIQGTEVYLELSNQNFDVDVDAVKPRN